MSSEYSRREFLGKTGAGASSLALAEEIGAFRSAVAQADQQPRINLGDNVYLDEVDGDYRVSHANNGEVFRYDPGSDRFTLQKPVDATSGMGGGGSPVAVEDDLDLQSSQEIQNAAAVSTEDLVDGADISHTGQLADLGQVFLATYEKTVGGGSVTDNSGVVQLREPGNASAKSESRLYSHIFEFDPSVSRRIRLNVENITIANSSTAAIDLFLSNSPDTAGNDGNDNLGVRALGDGGIRAECGDDGSSTSSTDTSQDNSYVSSLNYIEIRWDGSTLTAEVSDGSTTVTVSESTNYPSGETLHLKIGARDADGLNGRNVDFDVDSVVID